MVWDFCLQYCIKFRNFSIIAFKRYISNAKNSQLGCDLSISVTVDDRVIFPFLDGFIFVKIKPSQKFASLLYRLLKNIIYKQMTKAVA